jgi:arginyl-tRNA synthetase
MFRSVYDYLQSELFLAVNRAFPDINISKHDCNLNIAPEHSSCDLSSSIVLKIGSLYKSLSITSEKITSFINYDDYFVQSDPENMFTNCKGFINFKLSRKYISTVISNTSSMIIDKPDSVTDLLTSSVLSTTKSILSHFENTITKYDLHDLDLELLCTYEELKIGRSLGIAPLFPDCKHFKNKTFFKNRIADAFLQFYKKNRIITPDCKLTFARIALVKATQNALMTL